MFSFSCSSPKDVAMLPAEPSIQRDDQDPFISCHRFWSWCSKLERFFAEKTIGRKATFPILLHSRLSRFTSVSWVDTPAYYSWSWWSLLPWITLQQKGKLIIMGRVETCNGFSVQHLLLTETLLFWQVAGPNDHKDGGEGEKALIWAVAKMKWNHYMINCLQVNCFMMLQIFGLIKCEFSFLRWCCYMMVRNTSIWLVYCNIQSVFFECRWFAACRSLPSLFSEFVWQAGDGDNSNDGCPASHCDSKALMMPSFVFVCFSKISDLCFSLNCSVTRPSLLTFRARLQLV